MKCIDLLIHDHKVILRALEVLDDMAICAGNDETLDREDVESLLRFLRRFADDHHQTKEESALFPQLMRTPAAKDGPLRQMIFEHDQERSLVEGLEEALNTRKGPEFVHFATRLSSLLRAHIDKEDNALFKIAELHLSSEQDECIAKELNQFRVDPALLADLRRLEWDYLGRVSAETLPLEDPSRNACSCFKVACD
jgi:hemerythrin-like domain-containing protein